MTELVLYEEAKRAVLELLSVDEVRTHLGKAEAVQEYARRARDRELEVRAAEYRVYCERRVGEFSAQAAAAGNQGGRPSKTCGGTAQVSRAQVAQETGIHHSTLIRKHEPLAAIPQAEFEHRVDTLKAQGEVPTAAKVANLNSTKSIENPGADQANTPPEYVALIVEVLGEIDCDPCSDAGRNIPAAVHYTVGDNGLEQPWNGRVYCNPPYSEFKHWARKGLSELESGRATELIFCLPARPGSRWFRSLRAAPICFVAGRIQFLGHETGANVPSAFAYFGPQAERFCAVFSRVGDVWICRSPYREEMHDAA